MRNIKGTIAHARSARDPRRSTPADLDAAADQTIAACAGDAREAVKALLVANDFLEAELAELRAKVSKGYARGRLPATRARKEDPDV